jgi:endonuclease/exonuclease/phosphatase family metal-dependent hydrolase
LPVAAIDKAFVRGTLEVRHVRIAHSRLARDASDHLPLVIDFHLGKHHAAGLPESHHRAGHGP